MLITVKKEIEETMDVKAPCFLKSKFSDKYCHITEQGHLVIVNQGLVTVFKYGERFTAENICTALKESEPCLAEEFKQVFNSEIIKLQAVVHGEMVAA